jgi:hypothetical protein
MRPFESLGHALHIAGQENLPLGRARPEEGLHAEAEFGPLRLRTRREASHRSERCACQARTDDMPPADRRAPDLVDDAVILVAIGH